jgi:DNA invertase Pin-like site-specific DNA recombinase
MPPPFVDRLGRSLTDLLDLPRELQSKNVDLFLHQQGLDTSMPAGKAMFQILGVFAEFERAMLRERVFAGLARAKAQGKKLGRPQVSGEKVEAIRPARASGMGVRRSARTLRVGIGTMPRLAQRACVEA